MPFVNIKLVEGSVSPEEKHAMAGNAFAAAAPVGS